MSKPHLRRVCTVNPSKSEVADLDAAVSFYPMESIAFGSPTVEGTRVAISDVYQGFTYFSDGDVLLAKITPSFENGKGALAVGLINGVGFGTTELHVLRPISVDGRYLNWLVQSQDFRKAGAVEMRGAAGQQRVPDRFVAEWRLPVPDEKTQRRIADFLDRETGKIDSLVDSKRRLIDLLEEKAQTSIEHSALQWELAGAGKEGWSVRKLKRVAHLRSGTNITSDDIQDDGAYPVYGGNGLRGFTSTYTHSGSHVLIGRQGALSGNINYVDGDFFASEHAVVATLLVDAPVTWLGETLRALNLNQYSKAAAQPGLAVEVVGNLGIPVPPRETRQRMAADFDRLAGLTATATDRLTHQLDLLIEYRQALITAAVTGQLDEATLSGHKPADEALEMEVPS